MSIYAPSHDPHRSPRADRIEVLDGYSLNCGRVGYHLCRLDKPEKVVALWPYMKREIERLRRKNPPRMMWMPEHIRKGLMLAFSGQDTLECFVAHDAPQEGQNDTVNGMLICYPQIDPFVQLPLTWFVWLMCSEWNVLDRLLPEFEDEARRRGYQRWSWTTGRPGWARRAARFGANVVEWTVSKDL